MPQHKCPLYRVLFFKVFFLLVVCSTGFGEEWKIPLMGNAFPTDPVQNRTLESKGVLSLQSQNDRYAVYFRVSRATTLTLSVQGRAQSPARIEAHAGEQELQTVIDHTEPETQVLGEITVSTAGYQRVDIAGTNEMNSAAELSQLIVTSEDSELELDFVRDNQGNMFYWGRRGPSVHLRYQVPRDRQLTHAYTEITVPEGQDPIGTYYMANGFGEGYFGFQVNSSRERRVLFSVWSPFKTDDPRQIPKDQQITTLAQGEGVHIGKFGNEGSGGQSYLIYPWKAGRTYRFLTEVKPDGNGQTIYTSWFGEKAADEWRLIASFRRPQTQTYLRGFHSFLESFSPTYGHIGRRAWYGNVWVRDTTAQWHECTTARLTVDGTGRARHRLDFAGGVQGDRFFMRNCGFFNETVFPDQDFTRSSTASQQPQIDLANLPWDSQK